MTVEPQTNKATSSVSLRVTLTIAFIVLSIVSVLVVGSFQTARNLQAQRAVVAENERVAALEAANQVTAFVEENFTTLEISSRLSRSFLETEQAKIDFLDNILILQSAIREVSLLDAQGVEIVKESRIAVITDGDLKDWRETDLLRAVQADDRYIGDIRYGELTTEPLVRLAVPIKDGFGEFAGAITVELNLKFMWEVVEDIKIGETGFA
ncbi:MAG: cache domain-containing protein, partial [Chloroflexota bacterium]